MRYLNLVKKDMLLMQRQVIIPFGLMIVLPIFLSQKSIGLSCTYVLYMTMSFSSYILFNNIFLAEDKYKGNFYLMATPYKKSEIVLARYILLVMLFFIGIGIYIVLSILSPILIEKVFPIMINKLSFFDFSFTFLVLAAIYSLAFLLYYKFDFTKVKYFLFLITVCPCYLIPLLSNIFNDLPLIYASEGQTVQLGQSLLVLGVGIGMLTLSAFVATKIFQKRDFK